MSRYEEVGIRKMERKKKDNVLSKNISLLIFVNMWTFLLLSYLLQ